ncbi:MAG: hypothetical protein K9M94_11275 [Spirochaetia bacterium]|nr:hypothetical protein [Spirochaetia bacterium]
MKKNVGAYIFAVALCLVLLLCMTDQAAAQNRAIQASTVLGPPYPAGTDWKQVSTPHHRLIFPEGYEEEALRAAGLTDHLWAPLQKDFGIRVPPLPLVLNTHRQVSNGYVTLAPRHSEWYAFNSQQQFAGPVDWYSLLALHEGRHAVQFSALNRGFTRFARWAAGEYGWAFFSMYSMPLWYFEGDAILSETAFSSGGRGRSATFHRELRASVGEDRPVSYSQAYLGSYRSHFPNHYHLGYPLVTYIRLTYGEDAWNRIIEKTARFSFWPLRFHSAVKQVTGRSLRRVYRDALEYVDDYFALLEAAGGERGYTSADVLPTADDQGSVWTNYLPVAVEGGELFAIRYGDRDANSLVRLELSSSGDLRGDHHASEKPVVSIPGGLRRISLRNGVALWTEELPHPLWSKVSTSEIIRYELESGRRRRLTRGGAYQAPALSPEGRRIAVIRALPGGGGQLELLDAESGERQRTTAPELPWTMAGQMAQATGAEGPLYLRQPAWSPRGDRVAVIAVQGGRSRLLEYELGTARWKTVLGPVDYSISMPVYMPASDDPDEAGEYILYVSERSGTEALEAVALPGQPQEHEQEQEHRPQGQYDQSRGQEGQGYRVVSRPYAAAYPVVDVGPAGSDPGSRTLDSAGRLYFADYTVDGFKPAVMDLRPEEFEPLTEAGQRRIDYVGPIARSWGGPKIGAGGAQASPTSRENRYEVGEYRPLTGLLNFHSWGAIPGADGRVQLFSQSDDVLGRLSLMSFTGFNVRRESYDAGLQGSYRGLFPVIRFGLSGDTNSPGDPGARWNGVTAKLGFDAPLDLSRGVWLRQLSLSSTGFLRYEQGRPDVPTDTNAYVLPVRHAVTFYNASRVVAPADFAPPWEQYLELSGQYVAAPAAEWGSRFGLNGLLTLPGPWRQHRLQLSWTSESKSGEDVPLTSPTVRPRGYPFDWNDTYKADAVAALQYSLPLLYPDMELGNVYYLKRIRGTLFADLGIGVPAAEEGSTAGLLPAGEEPPQWLQELESGLGADLHPVGGIELLFEQHLFNWPIALEGGLRFVYSLRDGRFRVEDTLLLLGLEW